MTDLELKELKEIIRKVLNERTDIKYIVELADPIAEELNRLNYKKVKEND